MMANSASNTNTVEEILHFLGSPISADDYLGLLNVYPSFKVPFIINETRNYLNYFSTFLKEPEFQKRISLLL